MATRSSFFFQAEDGIRAGHVTGVQTCALPIFIALTVSNIDYACVNEVWVYDRATQQQASKVALRIPARRVKLPGTLGERSEEHTAELQSRGHLVCRLLLEKKKIHA